MTRLGAVFGPGMAGVVGGFSEQLGTFALFGSGGRGQQSLRRCLKSTPGRIAAVGGRSAVLARKPTTKRRDRLLRQVDLCSRSQTAVCLAAIRRRTVGLMCSEWLFAAPASATSDPPGLTAGDVM